MELHVRALFTHDADSRLLLVNEPGSEVPAARLFLGRTRAGNVWRFRADLPDELVQELERLCGTEPVSLDHEPQQRQTLLQLLERHAPVRKVSTGPAYYFAKPPEMSSGLLKITEANTDTLRDGFEELLSEVPTFQPFIALVKENRAVSVCRSVRITDAAHEAGVETLPEFRGRGYAKAVVSGWASLVHSLGAVPLYSTSWENRASQAVARSLGLTVIGADFQVT
jgi:RimJ/RimL family protein N-acetyltransferase